MMATRTSAAFTTFPSSSPPPTTPTRAYKQAKTSLTKLFITSDKIKDVQLDDIKSSNKKKEHNKNNNNKPHEQRTTQPRNARRLNHPFQHLHRHDNPIQYGPMEGVISNNNDKSSSSSFLTKNMTAMNYLKQYGGYEEDMILIMSQQFPPLLELNVTKHLRPKMRFLKYTLGGVDISSDTMETQEQNKKDDDDDDTTKETTPRQLSQLGRTGTPPQYYGARLERTIAPRHAFLRHMKLPHGSVLLQDNGRLLKEFLVSSRRTKNFCALCNTWRRKFGYYYDNDYHDESYSSSDVSGAITPQMVEAFDALFQRGLMAAARNDLLDNDNDEDEDDPKKKRKDSNNNSKITISPRYLANITSGELIHLLVYSGANPLERDVRGASLLHWAAGTGNLDGLVALCESMSRVINTTNHDENDQNKDTDAASIAAWTRIKRDGATTLHWAAAGAKSKEFGCGGHIEICRYLLDSIKDSKSRKDLANAQTKDGNSVLMWAAWSGTLDVVKLLVRCRADATNVQNRNGCTVAHWASSGGSLEVCKYLFETVGVDFTTQNYAGNTPLSHAVAYGRVDVVRWLKEELKVEDDDGRAGDLASDFLGWEGNMDQRRKKVFDLFQDWYGDDEEYDESSEIKEEAEFDVFH